MQQSPRQAAAALRTPDKGKVVSAGDAVKLIRDGDTVAVGGFVGIGVVETLMKAVERNFMNVEGDGEGSGPANLTLVFAAGQGDGKDKGLNHLAHEGLVKAANPAAKEILRRISGDSPSELVGTAFKNLALSKAIDDCLAQDCGWRQFESQGASMAASGEATRVAKVSNRRSEDGSSQK